MSRPGADAEIPEVIAGNGISDEAVNPATDLHHQGDCGGQAEAVEAWHDEAQQQQPQDGIVFSRIEDIPVEGEAPRFITIAGSGVATSSCQPLDPGTARLKFEIQVPRARGGLATTALSTFAELSNKLPPTVSLNTRKLPPVPGRDASTTSKVASSGDKSGHTGSSLVTEERSPVKENGFVFDLESANTVAEDMDLDEDEEVEEVKAVEDDEVVFLKASKSRSKSRSYSRSRSRSRSRSHSRGRSRSYSYSRSRSRSRSYSYSSYSSYSRSRSRGYSYSRSRERSYSYSSYSSRSVSRSRSPSIPRRRGSPSFLDKRRITRWVGKHQSPQTSNTL